jgi:hypothetical protein
MNRRECKTEKNFTRMLGFFVLALGLAVAVIGFVILPVVGLVFSIPVLALAALFIAAPESKACKLILRKA